MTEEEIDALVKVESEKAVTAEREKLQNEYTQNLETKDADISRLTSELETAKEALDKSDEGTKDWAATRNQIIGLEIKIGQLNKEKTDLKEEFSKEVPQVRTSIFQSEVDS